MKLTLKEEITRIHELTYGKKGINEQNIIDKIFTHDTTPETKVDDPKKADFVSNDLDTFYQTLEDAANSGGLTQQQLGSMTYQKNVETMQIGLILLGFQLPSHGVDGLYGPETAGAVSSFKTNLLKSENNNGSNANTEMLLKMEELLKQKGITSNSLKPLLDSVTTGGGAGFTDLDLTTPQGYDEYSNICQKYISSENPNAGITGQMMANGAKLAMEQYRKYIPPELALAQLTIEGGLSKNPNVKPIRTNNPFNVGNVDSGRVTQMTTKQDGINAYYTLISQKYLTGGKTAKDLINGFVNKNGQRYASDSNYETKLNQIASKVNNMSQPMLATTQNKENKIV